MENSRRLALFGLGFLMLLSFASQGFVADARRSALDQGETVRTETAPRKLKVLGFHGINQSAAMYQEITSHWDPAILDLIDFTFLDGWFPGGYPNEGALTDLYEWFQLNDDETEAFFYQESAALTLDWMEKNGPFDGVLGHSQGGDFAGLITALQIRGKAMNGKTAANLPPLKFYICSMGGHIQDPGVADLWEGPPMDIPTLHFISLFDPHRPKQEKNLEIWKDPVAIRLPQAHGAPIFGPGDVKTFVSFLNGVQSGFSEQAVQA